MLFNDYPFLLGFLPAAILLCRLADPYPQLRIWTLVLLSLAFYAFGNPPFIVLLVLSILINWLAALAYARTKHVAHHHGGHRRRSRRSRLLQIHQLSWLQSRPGARPADAGVRHRAAARHLVLYLPPHHVPGRSAQGQSAGLPARPLRALHRVFPAGARRPAGALVAGDATSSAAGSMRRAGSANSVSAFPSSRWACSRRSFLPTGSGASSIRSMRRRCRPRRQRRRLAGAELQRSRSCSISPAIPTSQSGSVCCSASSCRSISMRRSVRPAFRISGSAGTSP